MIAARFRLRSREFVALGMCCAAAFALTARAHEPIVLHEWRPSVDLPAGMPIRVEANAAGELPAGLLWRVGEESDDVSTTTVAVQPDPLAPRSLGWFRLPQTLAKGALARWLPINAVGLTQPPAPAFRVAKDERDLVVRYGRQELLRYAIAERTSDDADKDYLTRSGHIHPLTTLAGDAVTDDFSPDHPHQHGLFFAWTQSRHGDSKTEFWNQHLRRGTIRHAGLGPFGSDPFGGGPFAGDSTLAAFETRQVYRLPESDEPILEETFRGRCFVLDANVWLLDLTVEQRALTDKPFVNEKYHYGGLGIRSPRTWTPENATFLTSEGKDRLAGNHSRPTWTAMSGPADGSGSTLTPTIAVLDHPANFRYPQPVRLHPTMPYFAVAPMVEGSFVISRDRPFTARYAIVVSSDAIDAERLDALQQAFGADPTVEAK